MNSEFSLPAMGWILLTVACLLFIIIGLHAALKRTGRPLAERHRIFYRAVGILLIWTSLLLVLAYKGFFANFSQFPPRPVLVVLIPLPFIMFFSFSRIVAQIVRTIPAHWLVFMQSFRIAVEFMLVAAFATGKLPVQMTFEGRNFDIITGILALPVGYLLLKKTRHARKFAIAFNIIGLVLLINILVIAVLSMPTPFRYFLNEPSNVIVAQFPYILLPGVLVPMAYGLHILSLRQWLSKPAHKAITKQNVSAVKENLLGEAFQKQLVEMPAGEKL